MAKIKKFINCHVPVTTCNFRCHYCYITQSKLWAAKIPDFPYSADYMGNALSVSRLGGVCLFNLCGGGETLLPKIVPAFTEALLKEGHFVSIITNGSITQHIDLLIGMPAEYRERLMLKFSFQYLELCRLNLMDQFFDNFNRARKAGISVSLELVANDELIQEIPKIKEISLKKAGALCHIVIPRINTDPEYSVLTKLPQKQFLDIWSQFDSPLFDFKRKNLHVCRHEQFCYAGLWTGDLHMDTGDLYQCHNGIFIQNLFKDPTIPFKGYPCGKNCGMSFCYNAHAFLGLGDIPEMGEVPTYASFRDRICTDGTHWLSPKVNEFLSSKLYESNPQWGTLRKIWWKFRYQSYSKKCQQEK